MKCFKCGNALPDDSRFCQYCGTDLTQGHYCSQCGAVMQEEMNFCPRCGQKVHNQPQEEEITAPVEEMKQVGSLSEEFIAVDCTAAPAAIMEAEDESANMAVMEAESQTTISQETPVQKRKKTWIPLVAVGVAVAIVVGFFAVRSRQSKTVTPTQAAENVLYLEVYDSSGTCIGSGSGFLINDDVTLVTNYHVIEDAYKMIAMTADGTSSIEVGTVLAYDENADLAILKCNEKIGVSPLMLADSDRVKQGDAVYAAGYPLGIANTLTNGIVSSRYIDEFGVDMLQITAPISEGSSGGALLNEAGQVVGVVCAYYINGQNMNLAIAANTINCVLEENKHSQSLRELFKENSTSIIPEEPQPAPDETPKENQVPEESKTPEENEEVVCDHTYGEWKIEKEATCTQNGNKVRECSLCGERQESVIEATGHVYGGWSVVNEPTCQYKGEEARKCSLCGENQTKEISIVDHNYIDGVCAYCGIKDPTKPVATSISLDCKECFVEEGSSLTLNANIIPVEAAAKITWTSSDPERISVENGIVTVHSTANVLADITATTDNGLSATCRIYAKKRSPVCLTDAGLVYEQFPDILSIDNLFTSPECIAFWFEWSRGHVGGHYYTYSAKTDEQAKYYTLQYVDYLTDRGYTIITHYAHSNRFLLSDPTGKRRIEVSEDSETWLEYHSVTVEVK